MEGFTPLPALLGGVLIGLAAVGLLLFDGRIAGISGIVGGLLVPQPGDVAWRASFVGGLVAGGLVLRALDPAALVLVVDRTLGAMLCAGLLVGVGTRLGNGCTSGHGVCGIARGSVRSLAATAVFMLTGILTVAVIAHAFGGRV